MPPDSWSWRRPRGRDRLKRGGWTHADKVQEVSLRLVFWLGLKSTYHRNDSQQPSAGVEGNSFQRLFERETFLVGNINSCSGTERELKRWWEWERRNKRRYKTWFKSSVSSCLQQHERCTVIRGMKAGEICDVCGPVHSNRKHSEEMRDCSRPPETRYLLRNTLRARHSHFRYSVSLGGVEKLQHDDLHLHSWRFQESRVQACLFLYGRSLMGLDKIPGREGEVLGVCMAF